MARFADKAKRVLQNYIVIVQKVVVTLLLIIIYFIGFGITLILALIFNRKFFMPGRGIKSTFWIKAEGYESDIADSARQS